MISACMLLACGDESDLPSLPPLPEDGSAGTYLLSFEHDDMTRWAIVHIPQSYSPGVAAPMLLNFHGYGHGAEGHMEWADMRPLAEEHGFVLVYPHGAGDEPHWNCAPLSKDNKSTNRDLEFVEQLIDTIAACHSIDPNRVYAGGYSNGGMMAFGLACYAGERIAAIASVSGAMLDDIGVQCTPPHPTSVITLHGTQDSVLAYDGGPGMNSAEEAVAYWTDFNQITTPPTVGTSSDGGQEVVSFLYTGGQNGTEVQHHRIVGGGHVWFDLDIDGVQSNRVIWNFLSRFGRDGAL